ncbi:MAG TPA: L,D-transpeptidase family protein [Actinomycetota bacterium]|nr:L,D-transpeptidase family protein [Actinomycetota bacterium]
MARGRHTRRAIGRGWVVLVTTLALLVALGGGSAYAAYHYDRSSSSHIMPGVSVAGVDVSGMTREQAVRAVEQRADLTLEATLTVRALGHRWRVTPASLGTAADVQGAVERAFQVADTMSLVSRLYHRIADRSMTLDIPLGYTYDRSKVEAFVQQVSDRVREPAVNADFSLVDGGLSMHGAKTGLELKGKLATDRVVRALQERRDAVRIPVRTVHPEVTVADLGKTIVVDLSENHLYLYEGFKVVEDYPVATAAPGYTTPVGTWEVVNKAENPTWYNPAPDGWGAGEPLVIPPGPGNPLGTRALYLNAPGIRIHGTYSSSSIGTHASHGCIRMYISDAEQLYPLVPIGTKVIIKP